ncbi:RINGv domain containing protein-like protein [Leptotrombidium deliense]|uniref:RINGv domain containing protein-like protein n=1 Tax=Leptotrombidium deliense TaxID=299467 RepID=A0A443SND1_9ACAR|nr:RINGv domain containing protein-like protein [Leptotrombidium deliense]
MRCDQQAACRICFESGTRFLLQPCNCKGTAAFVHYGCLSNWTRVSGHRKCNVCKSEYRGLYNFIFRFVLFFSRINEIIDSQIQELLTGFYLIAIVLICLLYAWYLQWIVNHGLFPSSTDSQRIEIKKKSNEKQDSKVLSN